MAIFYFHDWFFKKCWSSNDKQWFYNYCKSQSSKSDKCDSCNGYVDSVESSDFWLILKVLYSVGVWTS